MKCNYCDFKNSVIGDMNSIGEIIFDMGVFGEQKITIDFWNDHESGELPNLRVALFNETDEDYVKKEIKIKYCPFCGRKFEGI